MKGAGWEMVIKGGKDTTSEEGRYWVAKWMGWLGQRVQEHRRSQVAVDVWCAERVSVTEALMAFRLESWEANYRQVNAPWTSVTLWIVGRKGVVVAEKKIQNSSVWAQVYQGEITKGEEVGLLISALQNKQSLHIPGREFNSVSTSLFFNLSVSAVMDADCSFTQNVWWFFYYTADSASAFDWIWPKAMCIK